MRINESVAKIKKSMLKRVVFENILKLHTPMEVNVLGEKGAPLIFVSIVILSLFEKNQVLPNTLKIFGMQSASVS